MTSAAIRALAAQLTNANQAHAIQRVVLRDENDQMYLTNYVTNAATERRKQNIEGTFTIMGTFNAAKRVRNEYEVKLFKHGGNEKGSFWCNCPDHKFNSGKKDMVCKHICFLVCKVGKLLGSDGVAFFESNGKQLTREQFVAFKAVAENTQQLLTNLEICRPPDLVTEALFRARPKAIADDDVCPICFDELKEDDATLLSCPTCKNYTHEECMRVWLERSRACVYCRSDVWSKFPM